MKKYILTATTVAFALFGLGSCSNDNDMDSPSVDTGNTAIEFRSLVDKSTKAAITTEQTIASFTITGWWDQDGTTDYGNTATGRYLFDGFNIARGENSATTEWDYSPKRYWPAAGKGTVDFFAYSPASSVNLVTGIEGYSGGLIKYTVPQVSENRAQEDFLVAKLLDKNSGSVDLNFKHALSRVKFFASYPNARPGVTYIVEKVELVNLYPTAELDYAKVPDASASLPYNGSPVWENHSGTIATYTTDMSAAPAYLTATSASLLGTTGAMMVMPQTTTLPTSADGNTPASTSEFALRISYKAYANGVYYAGSAGAPKVRYFAVKQPSASTPITFEMGRQYNFHLTFGEEVGGAMNFAVNVSDWVDNPEDISVPNYGTQAYFPDANFLAYILANHDDKKADGSPGADGMISYDELMAIKKISPPNSVASLEGAELMLNLTTIKFTEATLPNFLNSLSNEIIAMITTIDIDGANNGIDIPSETAKVNKLTNLQTVTINVDNKKFDFSGNPKVNNIQIPLDSGGDTKVNIKDGYTYADIVKDASFFVDGKVIFESLKGYRYLYSGKSNHIVTRIYGGFIEDNTEAW